MGPYKHVEELREAIEPVSVFAKLVDCVDMPATHYIIREVGMTATQEKLYKDMKKNLMSSYAAADGLTVVTHAKNTLVASLRLQQISSGFIVGQGQETEQEYESFADMYEHMLEQDLMPDQVVWLGDSIPKLDALLRDIEELDKPVIVLTRYTAEAAKIYDVLKDKYRTGLFTGWKVVGGIDEFKAGTTMSFVAIFRNAAGKDCFKLEIPRAKLSEQPKFSDSDGIFVIERTFLAIADKGDDNFKLTYIKEDNR